MSLLQMLGGKMPCHVSQVAIVTGLGAAPWVVKPVYGFLSDTVPIFGYRRRSYLIICGLLGEGILPRPAASHILQQEAWCWALTENSDDMSAMHV